MDVMVPDGLWIYVDNPFSIHISTEIPPLWRPPTR